MKQIIFIIGIIALGLSACAKKEEAANNVAQKNVIYHCPMHPTYTSPKPGTCPICGMDLVLVQDDGANPAAAKNLPSEHAAVRLSPERVEKLGVTFALVQRQPLHKTVTAPARVLKDAELYSAFSEYKNAQAAAQNSPSLQTVAEAARLKLLQMGIDREFIAEMEKSSDLSALLTPQTSARVWVVAEISPADIGLVARGNAVKFTSTAWPGVVFRGRILSIDQNLSTQTRTYAARVQVEQQRGLLRPEIYLTAEIAASAQEALVVPQDAVVQTGQEAIVFVTADRKTFEPRKVQTGIATDGKIAILSGLKQGETVIASANFLIDSESRMKAALNK